MSVVVKNVGPIEKGGQNQRNTSLRKSFGNQGTVRVSYENREYVFGPNDSKTLENGIAEALIAQDSRLVAVGTSEGSDRGTLRT